MIGHWEGGKAPRAYAYEIVHMKTRQERLNALHKVPEKYQDLVRRYVEIHFEMKKYARNNR